MTDIIYRNKDEFNGIWHLDTNALLSLDKIIDQIWLEIEKIKKNDIETIFDNIRNSPYYSTLSKDEQSNFLKEKEKEIQNDYYYSRSKRKLTIQLDSGNKFESQSFKEAFENPAIKSNISKEFEYHLLSGVIECKVVLERDSSLSISVTPEQKSEIGSLFLKLEQWVNQNKYPIFYYYWKMLRWIPILIFLGIFPTIISGVIISNDSNRYFLQYEAKKLIEDGLSQEEIPQAIEILLSLQSNSISEKYKENIDVLNKKINNSNTKLWIISILFFLLSIFTLISPSTVIGIGLGEKSISRQKKWIKFLIFVIPSFLIMGVFASFSGSLLFEYIKTKIF